jgi:hypothetical protein
MVRKPFATTRLVVVIAALSIAATITATIAAPRPLFAQLVPEIGYVHPAGGQPGTTVDVVLGGYDWSPDMQLFAHDPRIKLELSGSPTPVLVPDPPYWFGAKARGPAWPLPREFPAKLTIPADIAPGIVKWQAANANGASPVGFLHIGGGTQVVEDVSRQSPARPDSQRIEPSLNGLAAAEPQRLPSLPVAISGRIQRIEEIDRYAFQVPTNGPVTVELIARQIGSPLHGMVKIHDAAGRLVLDIADTQGTDLKATFGAEAGTTYTLSLHDLDFAGDRSYVYRLLLNAEPRVVAAFPAAGKRGTSQSVEFLGWGIATGAAQLESVKRDIAIPADAGDTFEYRWDTPIGRTMPWKLQVADSADLVEPVDGRGLALPQLPASVTGTLALPYDADTYTVTLAKDALWRIVAEARGVGSPLDVELSILGPDGKELMTQDDAPATTDATLLFKAPADGSYRIVVAEKAGASHGRSGFYRLRVAAESPAFSGSTPATVNLPLGGKAKLTIPVIRAGGFADPVAITLSGLPPGVKPLGDLAIPKGKNDVAIELECAADAPAQAALVQVTATATIDGQPQTKTLGQVLVATTLKPRFKLTPEGLDDVRKVQRGSTFLAPLLIERLDGFADPIILEMTSKQQRHRQGLASGEFTIEPGAARIEYPIFVPEWMETTKTSRMILNGTARVADPKGNVRTLVQRMELRIGVLPQGALLKVTHAAVEPVVQAGGEVEIPVLVSRAPELRESVRVDIRPADGAHPADGTSASPALTIVSGKPMSPVAAPSVEKLEAAPVELPVGEDTARLKIRVPADTPHRGQREWIIRAATLRDGRWPVVSEATLIIDVR